MTNANEAFTNHASRARRALQRLQEIVEGIEAGRAQLASRKPTSWEWVPDIANLADQLTTLYQDEDGTDLFAYLRK